MEGPDLQFSEAVIDNGAFGRHVVRFETGLLARQAAGSATVYLDDDTMVLSATTAQNKPREALDFFPLTVDVEERMYAARPHPRLVLPPRGPPVRGRDPHLPVDRPAAATLLRQGSAQRGPGRRHGDGPEPDKLYDVVAINAASLSTQLAGLPFTGPVGGVRVALIGDQWVGFPDVSQLEEATFDMVVAGRVTASGDVAIMMVEAESTEATWDLVRSGKTAPTEEVVAAGLEAAKPFIKALCDAQAELAAKAGSKTTAEFPVFLDYRTTCTTAVSRLASDELAPGDDHRRQAGARGGHRGAQGPGRGAARPQFEGREKEITRRLPGADQEAGPAADPAARRCASTAAA